MNDTSSVAIGTPIDKIRNVVLAVNVLYALSFVVGITSVAGGIVAYLKRGDANGTLWEGHFTYAIRTFWMGLGMGLAGLILSVAGIGVVILVFVAIWYIIRVVRGFLAWNDGAPIADPRRFF